MSDRNDARRVRDCDVVHPKSVILFFERVILNLGYPRARVVGVRGGWKEDPGVKKEGRGGEGGERGRCINNSYILMNRPLPRSKNSFNFGAS